MPADHMPVLLERIVGWLVPRTPGLIVDATVGLGGHSAALLAACPECSLIGLDRDPEAIERARKRLQPYSDRVRLVHRCFAHLPEILVELDAPPPAAVLADLGTSSFQLDAGERGFSFQHDGPLDMRMGGAGPTAADFVNAASEDQIVRVLKEYGEERKARRIARAVVRRRAERPLQTTGELADLVVRAVGPTTERRLHPATRTFQAIRIEINDELGELESFLEPAARALAVGGRIAVISFHSLEDRIVKHGMRRLEGRCVCPPDLPVCRCRPERLLDVLTRRPERPTEAEIESNPRARSARLRVAERVGLGD